MPVRTTPEVTGFRAIERPSPRELALPVSLLSEVAASLDDIELRNGPTYILDYNKYLAGGQSACLPVIKTSYFPMLLCHPGMHAGIVKALEPVLEQRCGQNLVELREQIEIYHHTNPLRRPAPLGVTVACTATDPFGNKWCLNHQRSDSVAVNPGVWTTAVDEGVHREGDFESLARSALREEVDVDQFSSQDFRLRYVGLMVPDESPISVGRQSSAQSGANVIFEAMFSSVDDLRVLTKDDFEVTESSVVKVDDVPELMKDQTVSEGLAGWLSIERSDRAEPVAR